MFKDLVLANRSYRRYDETAPVGEAALKELVNLARFTPSTANSQALKFRPVYEKAEVDKVFPCLGWAGALKDWPGPAEGERPTAYIVILCDSTLGQNKPVDVGITAQTMLLGAVEMGLGGCMLGSVNRQKLAGELGIDTGRYSIELVIALGKPHETIRLVDVPESGDIRYYRDAAGVHYVPKRKLEDLIL